MKRTILAAIFILSFVNAQAQWTVPKPLTIFNNTSLNFNYQIIQHSAFYDGTNDGIINGTNGPFNMSTLNSSWTTDIVRDHSVCNQEVLGPFSPPFPYSDPAQNGLPVNTYSITANPGVSSLTDYAQYFRTFYLKCTLSGGGIYALGGGVRYPVPTTMTMPGLTPIAGTSFSYDTNTNMLYDTLTTTLPYSSFLYVASGNVPGSPYGFTIQFLEFGGTEYVICSQFP